MKIGNPMYGKIVKEKKKNFLKQKRWFDPLKERCGYVFTVNNWTQEQWDDLTKVECRWMIFGKEIAPTTGTPHLQGEIYFNQALNLWNALQMFPFPPHFLEPWKKGDKRGTGAGVTYCGKDANDVFEKGRRIEQGVDVDIRTCVHEQQSMRAVFEMTKDPRRISVAKAMMPYIRPEYRNVKTYWFYGRNADKMVRPIVEKQKTKVYYCDPTSKYWEGYDGEKIIVIYNYRKKWCDIAFLLSMIQGLPMRVSYRFGSHPLCATSIVITSDVAPISMYFDASYSDSMKLEENLTMVKHCDD